MKTLLALAAALSVALAAHAAPAGSASYTGNWKVSLTKDVYPTTTGYNGHGPDSTHCIQLSDDGSVGWPHSGYALLDGQSYGQFSVVNHTIFIYIETVGSGQELADLTFRSTASNGAIGQNGAYNGIQGGYSFDAAVATFGAKGSC